MESPRISSTARTSNPIEGVARPRARAGRAASPAGQQRDQVEVSSAGRDLARVEVAVGGAGELRFDVVSRLRAEVKAGEYHVDPGAVARAMVERGEQA